MAHGVARGVASSVALSVASSWRGSWRRGMSRRGRVVALVARRGVSRRIGVAWRP
ncbi:hypothetical protein ACXZ9C_11355 [Streptococcus agalactiae]